MYAAKSLSAFRKRLSPPSSSGSIFAAFWRAAFCGLGVTQRIFGADAASVGDVVAPWTLVWGEGD
jgi:hypothetical protein